MSVLPDRPSAACPPILQRWFQSRGWDLHPHQRAMLDTGASTATLLIAPTGAGKTLAGFLPSLAALSTEPQDGLHTLYVSPLKALATDIKRNLSAPIAEMQLPIRVEDRTGDTSAHAKRRQRADPPHILLTTPESLALLLSYPEAPRLFSPLKRVIVDELHAFADSKRGSQLFLSLARLQGLAPTLARVGLSATVEDPDALAARLAPPPCAPLVISASKGPPAQIAMLDTTPPPPWSGGGAAYAIPAVLAQVKAHKTTLVFHNTRAQAEIFFRNLWLANTEDLPIAIHHGALAREQRDAVEAAMVAGKLRAVVCTGTLDLGLDWGDVDLVIQVGAPKNIKRLIQRIGRAGHRHNLASKAFVLPANRFEVVECQAAIAAARAGQLDGDPLPDGPLDVLCQHILISACSGPFAADALFAELATAGGYHDLPRAQFDRCLDFCATGGYALRAYDQWQRLQQRKDGLWQLRDPRAAARIRMNIGTIQDADLMKVRLRHSRGGKPLGEIEEAFAATLSKGDTFLIGGQTVRYEGLREMTVEVTRNSGKKPKIAVFSGTKFATSTQLSTRVLAILNQPSWADLPAHTADWLTLQANESEIPSRDHLLVESFPHQNREYLCAYGFAGRNAQQTLGLMLTRRMEAMGLDPLGFVASDYATLIWGLGRLETPETLFALDTDRLDLDGWLAENAVMKRSFRAVATIAGLIERNLPGSRKSGRQATFSSDILYDTLRKYDPDHLLLQIARDDALRGLVDFGRIEALARRIKGRTRLRRLERVSPLAAPLLLEVGKVPIKGAGSEKLLQQETEALMRASGLAGLGT